MAPATIQLVFGVMEVLLRAAGLLMAVGTIFLFFLHRFAARSVRASWNEEEGVLMVGPNVPRPALFMLSSTRGASQRASSSESPERSRLLERDGRRAA